MGLLAAALAAVACCGLALAQSQRVEGHYAFFDPGESAADAVPLIALRDGRSFVLAPAAVEQLRRMQAAGRSLLVPGRSVVQIELDEQGRAVSVEVVAVDDAVPAEPKPETGERPAAALDRWARSLKNGVAVEIDTGGGLVAYRFVRYEPPDLVLSPLEGEGALAVIDLRRVRAYRRAPRAGASPSAGSPQAVEIRGVALRPGRPVEINGVRGFVVAVDATQVELQTPRGERWRCRRDEVSAIRPLRPADLAVHPARSERERGPANESRKVEIESVEARFDPAALRTVVRGTVVQRREKELLVGLRLRVRVRGWRVLPLAEQLEAARAQKRRGYDLVQLAEIGASFELDGVRHRAILVDGRPVVVELGEIEREQIVEIPPVLPGLPVAWRVDFDVYTERPPMVQRVAGTGTFVSLRDERAIVALAHAFENGSASQRRAALQTMAATKDVRLLPVLLWQAYLGSASQRSEIAKVMAAYGEPAIAWLRDRLKTGQGERIEVAIGDTVEQHKVRAPVLRQVVLELLEAIEPQAAFPAALALANDPAVARETRERAREVFLSHRSEAVRWLLEGLLRGETACAPVLLAMQERFPETLRQLEQSLGIESTGALEAQLAETDDPKKRDRLRLRHIVSRLRSRHLERDTLVLGAARATIDELLREREALHAVRRRLAERWVLASSEPPADADARAWTTACLLRAAVLAPGQTEAGRALARVALEVAREVSVGPALRSGPGFAFSVLRPLHRSEVLLAVGSEEDDSDADSASTWLEVHSPEGEERGWVRRAVLAPLSRPGAYRVARLQCFPSIVQGFVELARQLDPSLADQARAIMASCYERSGERAAAEADWKRAVEAYRNAGAWQPGRYRSRFLLAYARANAGVSALVVLCLFGLVFAGLSPAVQRRVPPAN
ncbi:MAG: hypothetical protein D6776_09220 [Planctomycetota bacterium]|nr:MAG: hypothetical protein D6776_09220 [Planctomycetota bacterium]